MKVIIFVLVAIIFLFSFSINYFEQVFAEEELVCPVGEVVVIRVNNSKPICVDQFTAIRWAQLGITEIVGESVEEKTIEASVALQKDKYEKTGPIVTSPSFDENSVAQSYIVRIFGGQLEETLVYKTFSRVEQGDTPHYIKSFYDLGFPTYFLLESLPSKDKSEFYKLVSDNLRPVSTPELFDTSIDFLTGDGSILATANYSKCKITGYTPYTQEYILFYQYSGEPNAEIRDSTTIYCNGLRVEVYDPEENISEYESVIPTEEDRATHYVVHFYGPDFDGLYTVNTFSKFSPSENKIETPFDTITFPGNPMESHPQFILESIPSKDKVILYKVFAERVSPGIGVVLGPFDVSIDMVTGDGTILQRWNYVNCDLADYGLGLQDSILRFPFAGEQAPEIRDKSDIACIGLNLEVPRDSELEKFPIKAPAALEGVDINSILDKDNTAQAFTAIFSGGELEDTYISVGIQNFEPIVRHRGEDTPVHHGKQFDYGFILESLPNEDRINAYKFLSQYINLGGIKNPFDVKINTITGDGTILHTLKYVNCDAVDFSWYLQDYNFIYQFNQKEQPEIREKYVFYCDGFRIEVP